jgi:hypothetical protein
MGNNRRKSNIVIAILKNPQLESDLKIIPLDQIVGSYKIHPALHYELGLGIEL